MHDRTKSRRVPVKISTGFSRERTPVWELPKAVFSAPSLQQNTGKYPVYPNRSLDKYLSPLSQTTNTIMPDVSRLATSMAA